MNVLKAANLALSFFLELCLVVAYGLWGFATGSDLITKLALGIGVPAAVIVVWSIFLAPASKRRLTGIPHWILEIALFALSMVALYLADRAALSIGFAVLYVINVVLRLAWRQS